MNVTNCCTRTDVWVNDAFKIQKFREWSADPGGTPVARLSVENHNSNNSAVRQTAESTVCHVWYGVGPANTSPFTPDHIPVWLVGCAIKTSPWELCMCLRAWVTFRLLCRHLCWHLRGYRRGTAPEPSAADDSLYPLQYAELVESHTHTHWHVHVHTQTTAIKNSQLAQMAVKIYLEP